jgi:hypothetical protein
MYKAQYKGKSPFSAWVNIGTYPSESQAINAAIKKKTAGALLVRVVDKKGGIVYSS